MNSLGAINDSLMVYDLVDDLTVELAPLFGLAYDFGGETADDIGAINTIRPGDTVLIKDWFGDVATYQVDPAVGYVKQDYAVRPDIPFTMPTDITAATCHITSAEYRVLTGRPGSGAYDRLRDKMRSQMTRAIREKLLADFFAEITATNFTYSTAVPIGTMDQAAEIDLDTAIFQRNISDRRNATLIHSPECYGEWAKDHLSILDNTGQNQDKLMTGGHSSNVSSFRHWRTNVPLPADSIRAIAFTRTAMLWVARAPHEAAMGSAASIVDREVVTGQNGIPFLARLWENPANGDLQLDLGIISKFQKLQDEAIQRITA